jgi:hypothetical protein
MIVGSPKYVVKILKVGKISKGNLLQRLLEYEYFMIAAQQPISASSRFKKN